MRKRLAVLFFSVCCMMMCFFAPVYASEITVEDTKDSIEVSFEEAEIAMPGVIAENSIETFKVATLTEDANFTDATDDIFSPDISSSEVDNTKSVIDSKELSGINPNELHNFNQNFFEGTSTLEDIAVYSTIWAVIPVKNGTVNVPSSATVTGASAKYIKLLQCCLNALGYNAGSADGIYGTNTKNAIISFQRKNSLSADGIAGENTWRKIDVLIYTKKITVMSYTK